MKKLVSFFVERSLLVNIISAGLIIAGVIYIYNINKEALPVVDYGYVAITTIYPGASPEDVEKHVTIPIENQVREVDGIDNISSTSLESRSSVLIKLDPDIENQDKTVNDIKNSIDSISDLPDNAEDPNVLEVSTSLVNVINISIINKDGIHNDNDERELRKYAKMLEDKLLEIPGLARIYKNGYRDREMIVEVHPDLLDKYHVGINEIILALSKKNLNFPGGLLKTGKRDIMVRTIGEVESARDIEDIFIRSNNEGYHIRIGDVATVRDSFKEETITNSISGQKAISFSILKKESADIIKLVEAAKKEVEEFKKQLGKNYDIIYSDDYSYYVKRRLNVLKNNALVGIVLVVLSLLLTLGWRISLVTALGIPLAFCGTFIWMGQKGVTINLMSMFGLIIVVGMLVDDAIVVAENVYRHLEEGKSPKDAVIAGTSEVIMPVAGTIITTIAAFAPIMLMPGIYGRFMWTLPAVVIVALLASWLEAMFILPSHILDIEKRRKKIVSVMMKEKGKGIYKRIQSLYVSILKLTLDNKYKFSLLITILFFLSVGFAVTNMKFILFPKGKIDAFLIKAEAANGTSLEAMNNKLAKMEQVVNTLPSSELENIITRAGIIQTLALDPEQKRGSNYGMITVNLTPEDDRDKKADEIIDYLRDKSKTIQNEFVKLEFELINTGGAPDESPIKVTIKGDDFDAMRRVSDEYMAYLKDIRGLKDIKESFEEGKDELDIYVNESLASIAGISVYDVASTVRSCIEGAEATKIKKSDEEILIRVIFPEEFRKNIENLKHIKIANRMGNLIPISRIVKWKLDKSISKIERVDFRRAIQVTADIDQKSKETTSVSINNRMIKDFTGIEDRHPGITVAYGGEYKETQEAMGDLKRSFMIAVIIIYIILVALFRSLSHPLIIMSIIPLAAIGVIWALFFHGLPFSFLGMMGIVGLAGVIVNDSIVLTDFIRKNRANGMHPYDASVKAGASRLRPVFLTTITTFLGLVPTIYGLGGFDPFVKPMAVAMAWGLVFGTVITLFITPVLYNMFSDIRKLIFRADKSAEAFEADHYEDAGMEEKIIDNIKRDIKKDIKKEIVKDVMKKIKTPKDN